MQRKPKRLRAGVKQAGTKVETTSERLHCTRELLWVCCFWNWRRLLTHAQLQQQKADAVLGWGVRRQRWKLVGPMNIGEDFPEATKLQRVWAKSFLIYSYREYEHLPKCLSDHRGQTGGGGTRMKIGILLEVWVQTIFKTKNETTVLYWNKGYAAKVKMNTEQLRWSGSVGAERGKKALWLPRLHPVWWARKNPDTGVEVTGCDPCFIPC